MHNVFLENCGQEGIRYFVSKAENPPQKLAKQNLIYNILIFNDDGTKIPPLHKKMTEIFFKSFTYDILNNNEVAKKSILQKIAELYIEN